MKRPEISFENDPQDKLQKGILHYYKCAKILLDENNSEHVQKCIRNIINKQANSGRTPLHLAATDWPKNIIKSLLKFGADLSIRDEKNKIPLTQIPESLILEVLDNHCIKSKSKTSDIKWQKRLSKGIQMDGTNLNDDEDFQELQAVNDRRFLTNIVKSPVFFDFQLLAPKRNSANPNIYNNKFCQSPLKSKHDPEMSVLSRISRSEDHQNILKHPVIKSFVLFKWHRGRTYYNSELRTNILITFLLSWSIFNQFGGLEMNNKHHLDALNDTAYPTFVKTRETTDAQFCDYYLGYKEDMKNNIDMRYGALEAQTAAERVKFFFKQKIVKINGTGNASSTDASNEFDSYEYINIEYFSFLVIAILMLNWMAIDIKSMLFPSTLFRRRFVHQNRRILAKLRSLPGYVRDIVIIIMVLVASEKMVWISVLILFLCVLGRDAIRILLRIVVGFNTMPFYRREKKIHHLLVMILVLVVMYVPNQYISDPLFYSQSEQTGVLCPTKNDSANINITVEHHLQVKRALAAFIIVLSWTDVLFQSAKHPGKMTEKFNKYVQMYITVASSFMRLILVYMPFLIAFSLGFYVMFHNDIGTDKLDVGENNISPYRFFETPLESFAKTIAMFVGEVDFNNIPVGVSYGRRDGNISTGLRYLFFIVFIFMVVMVLMNLLNGLAITDITRIVDEAEARHQRSMIDILKELEDRARGNQEIVEFVSRVVPCLYPFVKAWGFLEELKIFHPSKAEQTSNDNEQGPKGSTCIQFPPPHYDGDEGFPDDYLLKQARQILLKNSQEKSN